MSFGWLTTFRLGSWKAFRTFVLQERRDVAARLAVINAEVRRIGEVTVYYRTADDGNGGMSYSEARKGFSVTRGSTLEKLVQAYIAMGGNPLDISMFLKPDRAVLKTDFSGKAAQAVQTQPSDGVAYPKGEDFDPAPGIDESGFISLLKYPPRRMGGRRAQEGDEPILTRIRHARGWVNQSIRHKRNNLEARIIKQMDLREQLEAERDIVIQNAVGGTLNAIESMDSERFLVDLQVARIVAHIDSIFFLEDTAAASVTYDLDSINGPGLNNEPTLFVDELEDSWTAL